MSKRIISLFLALSFILVSCQLTFAEGETVYDISAGSQIITASGDYKITGTTTTNTLTIGQRNTNGTFEEVTVNLILDNVNISSASANAINIYPNAKVNLTLVGSNTLKSTGSKKAALLVNSSAGVLSKLIINGSGSLTVSSGADAAAIGSQTSDSGEIVINGGRITATGGNRAAAIGSAYNQINSTITINGGYIKVTGTRGIGSGTGKAIGAWGDIVVNGGSIIEENVTNTWENLGYQPKNSEGENVSKITLTMPDASENANKELTINGWSTVTDDSAKLYTYVTEDTASIAAKSSNGDIYYCKNMNISAVKSYTLSKYTGDPCVCTTDTALISLDNIESSAAVNVIEQRKEIELKGEFIPSLNCEFPIHNAPADIIYSIAEKNNADADLSGIAEISGNMLTVYSGAVGKTLVLTAATENNLISYTASKEITITQDESIKFDISENNIVITNKDSDNLNVQVGTIDFTVPKNKEITIYQKTASTSNYITVSADAAINLDNVNIRAAGVNNAIKVNNGAALNLKLKGNNTLVNAIIGENTSSINISGNGTLNVSGGGTAAIGGFNSIVIDSGTIRATGGNLCAGIGGNANSSGSNVTINGGKITATGLGYAAGIGGGDGGSGGTVIINGGMVKASGGSFGIGGGSTTAINHGMVTVNGGSVNATIGADISKYMCTLSGISANRDIEYTIGDSAETIKTSTDSSGLLYFYLPEGENKIKVIYDGKTYYERLDIDSSDTNTGVLSSEITTDITSLKILNRAAEINQVTGEILITLPNNLNLANAEAQIKHNGYKVVATEGSIQDLSVKYTVFGDDGVTDKTYTLTITLTEPGNEKDILDISEGSIYISKEEVLIVAGDETTSLMPNPNGYIITGTSDIYMITIEEDISDIDVVFRDLHIKSTSETAPAMEIYGSVNIQLEGDNIIEATQSMAIMSDGSGDINISGTGNLTVKGGAEASALDLNYSSLSITSLSDSDSGKIILEGGSNSQAAANGVVLTNTTTNLKIIDNGTSKTYVTDGSVSLNSVKVILPVENADGHKCTYSGKGFTLDADNAFYLMLPNEEHIISVTYNNNTYLGRVDVNGEAVSVTLEGEKITNITLSSPGEMTYKGGEAVFVVEGIIDPNKTKIQFVPNRDGFETLTANVTFDLANNRDIVTVTLPENTSGTDEVKYTIKGLISDKVVYTAENAVVLPINDTYCNITEFTMASGTTTQINDNNGRINVTFPFDHVLVGSYEVNIAHTGSRVTSPSTTGPSTYYFGALDSYEAAARFEVTAKNGTTRKTYTAILSTENKPAILNVTVDTSSLTNKGGKLKVEIEGSALGNVVKAEKAENRVVTVSVGDKNFTATPEMRNKVWYVAEIEIDANTETTAKTHNVTVQIGSEELNISKTVQITQSKGDSNNANIKSVSIEKQINSVVTDNNTWTILMPFDANLASLTPTIVLEDRNASYTPTVAQNFTSGDVIYTVTAQNGTTMPYHISVTKQAEPVATGVSFTAPATGAVNDLDFTVEGDNLENIEAAISGGKIVVKCTPQGGGAAITGTAELKNGKYVASLTGLSNNDTTADKIYTVSVEINGKAQTLTGGNPTLTVPRRKSDTCDIADFKLIDGQTGLSIVDGTITLKVPYNTDLRSLTPQITLEDSKGQYSDAGIAKNFENDVTYTVTSESGKTKTYTVSVSRDGQAGITAVSFEQPLSNKPGNIVITLTGNFINSLGDAITVTAASQDSGNAINAVIDYTEYAGAATATLSLPDNEEETDKKYVVSITMNGAEQTISNNEIVVPAKKPCSILSFKVGDIVARPDADNKITLKVPYETDLTKITPLITIEGESCEPASGTEQDFTNPVTYTVTESDETKAYEVTITRDGKPSINAVTIKNAPTSNKGGQVTVELEGVFWNSAKVKVIAPDNTSQEVNMTVSEAGKATAEITIPTNDSLTDVAEYTLEFYLDGFAEKIETTSADKITVPVKKPCSILSFKVGDVVAVPDADNKITLKVPYETDLTKITPEIEIEGDRYEQTGEQDFTSPVAYTVYDGSNTNTYEVTITRDGKPSINTVTIKNAPTNNKGGQVTVELDGIFWNSAKVKVIAPDNTLQEVNMTVSEAGKASAAINIAENTSTTDDMEYKLEFYLDGFEDQTEYDEDVKIIVPFRKNNANMESSSSRVKPKTTPVPTPLPEQTEKPSDGQVTPEPSQTPDITPKTMPYIRGYEEFGQKLFKPNNTITRAEVAAIMSLLDADFDENAQYSNSFSDVARDTWYSNYISYAAQKGYIQGYDDRTSRPENNITRAEFASIIARYINAEEYTGMSLFRDIDNIDWCRSQINALAELGIVNGYDNAMFMPNKLLTRAEAVVMINRAINRVMTDEIKLKLNNPFDDVDGGHWAYDDILLASCEY